MTLQSFLLVTTWLIAGLFGNYLLKTSRVGALVMNMALLALVVELFGSRGSGSSSLITNNLGSVALILLGASLLLHRLMARDVRPVSSPAVYGATQFLWGLALSVPVLSLVVLRWLDTRSFNSWYLVDINAFRGNEDNSKWLGVASRLVAGESVGVEAIGGFLVVLQRGSLAIAQVLSTLGIRTLSSELSAVTFSTQLVKELLVLSSPFVVLRAASREASLRQRLNWLGPGAILNLIAQLVAFVYGFLSFQVALALGSLWIILRIRNYRATSSSAMLEALVGTVFLFSWLPLRLLVPFYVAWCSYRVVNRTTTTVRLIPILLAVISVLPTYGFVFGIRPKASSGISYTKSLLESSGGVFAISQWLVLLAVLLVFTAVVTARGRIPLHIDEKGFLWFVGLLLLVDVALTGRLGYGSTKLLFLTLILGSLWASAVLVDSRIAPQVRRPTTFLIVVGLFLTTTTYSTGLNLWGSHAARLISPTAAPPLTPVSVRINDPLRVMDDFGKLNSVLQTIGICTETRCELEKLPRACIAIYDTHQKQMMHRRVVRWVDAMSSEEMSQYLCTRFLSEISRGTASTTDIQNMFFFVGDERLRDSIVHLAAVSPETRLLVAREGKSTLEVHTVADLLALARQTYPLLPNCDGSRFRTPPKWDCFR